MGGQVDGGARRDATRARFLLGHLLDQRLDDGHQRLNLSGARGALCQVDVDLPGPPPVGTLGDGTVGAWLETWLAGQTQLPPTTRASYAKNIRLHLIPAFGDLPLGAITPERLAARYARWQIGDRKDHKAGGLSLKTTRYLATILGAALSGAVDAGLIDTNPAKSKRSKPPRPSR